MKKLLMILLVLTMLLSLAACGANAPAGGSEVSGGDNAAESPQNIDPPADEQPEAFENRLDLSLDKTHYEREERIEVTMDFADVDQDNAVIVTVGSDMPHGQTTPSEENCAEYRWLADFSEIPFYLWAPDKDGLFDVRVYSGSDGGEELASVTVAVGSAELSQATGAAAGPQGASGQGGQVGGDSWPAISYLKDTDKYMGDGKITQVHEWDASGDNGMWTIYCDGATFGSVESYVAGLVGAGWTNHYADEDGKYMEETTDKGTTRAYYCTCDYAEVEIQIADFSNSMNFTDKAEFSFNLSIEFSKP